LLRLDSHVHTHNSGITSIYPLSLIMRDSIAHSLDVIVGCDVTRVLTRAMAAVRNLAA
jgi:hypothetical protein